MLSRFSDVLQTAADVLAPPATRVDDFEYHWKLIQNLYVNQTDSIKTHVEATKIPFHLHQMLQLLIDEEAEQPNSVGPCLELIVNKIRGILDCLSVLAEADYPPGIRGLTLTWYTSLLRRIKQPFVHHMSVYQPIQKLLIECNKLPASPTEKEEVELLLTLCGLVRKQPDLANIFTTAFLDETLNKAQEENVPKNSPSSQCSSSMRTPKRNSLFNFDGLLGLSTYISIVSLSDLESSGNNTDKRQITDGSTSSMCGDDDILKKNIKMSFEDNDKFLLMDLLITYLDSADNHIILRACEGVMIVSSLPDVSIASLITNCSSVCEILVDKLIEKFKLIPANTDPSDVEQLNCTWGFIVQDFTEKQSKWFVGYKEVTTFLSWLDYCDTLMKECHLLIANHLSTTFRRNFLEATVERGLSDYHHTVLVTAVLSKCIRTVDSLELINEISNWLVGEGNLEHWPILHILIENCLSDRHELCLETLRFFETVIEKPTEHVLHRLVLCYVNGRGYHFSPSKLQTTVNTWSDEEDERDRLNGVSLQQERERNREIMKDICSGRKCSVSEGWQEYSDSHITSQTIVPDEIHKAVNSFLLLLPRNLLSDPGGVGYEQYMQDAHRQYQSWLEVTSGFHWPTEVTWPEAASSTHSCDSRPEADLHLVHSPDNTTECYQQKLNNQKINTSACGCVETNHHLKLYPNHTQDVTDSGNLKFNNSEDLCYDDQKECLFSQTLVMKSKQRCCLNRTDDEDNNSFDEGPFLRMLFTLVSNMANQPYQINLQLTSIISKMALLPHPYLHEYLLNTAIPIPKSVDTLYRSLKSVARSLTAQIPKTKNYKSIIEKTRQELLGDDQDDESNIHNSLFESLIVMEEFCKELAAIASVKYHHCSQGNSQQS